MHLSILSLFGALCAATFALSTPKYVVHEKRTAPLKQWIKRSELLPTAKLPMRIGLTQRNVENGKGDEILNDM